MQRIGGLVAAAGGAVQQSLGTIPASLIAWLREHGGLWSSSLEMRVNDPGYMHVVTNRRVPRGEVVMFLPPKLMLDADTTGPMWTEKVRVAVARQDIPVDLWQLRLGLRVMHERVRGADSLWAPYINALPAAFPGDILRWGGGIVTIGNQDR